MKFDLPKLADQLSSFYETGLGSQRVVQLFVGLSLEEALVLSLLFLPFFLLACLAIFKLFNYSSKVTRYTTPVLIIAYFLSIGFLKLRGEQDKKVKQIKNDVIYYMTYHFDHVVPYKDLSQAIKVEVDDLYLMKEKDQLNSFSFIGEDLHLKDPELAQLMNDRVSQLSASLLNAVQETDAPLPIEEIIADAKDFGEVSEEIIKEIVANSSSDIQYISSDEGDFVSVP